MRSFKIMCGEGWNTRLAVQGELVAERAKIDQSAVDAIAVVTKKDECSCMDLRARSLRSLDSSPSEAHSRAPHMYGDPLALTDNHYYCYTATPSNDGDLHTLWIASRSASREANRF